MGEISWSLYEWNVEGGESQGAELWTDENEGPNRYEGMSCYEYEEDKCYHFQIKDSYHDGICCKFGQGSYQIVMDNKAIYKSDGQYASEDNVRFCAPDKKCLSIRFHEDIYSDDITWNLFNRRLKHIRGGDIEGLACHETDDDDEEGCFYVEVYDAHGDGLCCEHGHGSWEILYQNDVLYKSDGIFNWTSKAYVCKPGYKPLGFDEGEKVEVNWLNLTDYYRGEIAKVQDNGLYTILYEDTDREVDVPVSRIRPRSFQVFVLGDKVMGNYEGNDWSRAKITNIHDDARHYDIEYEDESLEDGIGLPGYMLRPRTIAELTYEVGDTIYVNWRHHGHYYKATITQFNQDGSLGVEYEDGEEDLNIHISDFSADPEGDGIPPERWNPEMDHPYEVGEIVEANWANYGRYYRGRIMAVEEEMRYYSIDYDASHIETKVPYGRIRPFSETVYSAGDRVEVDWQAFGVYYPGTIVEKEEYGQSYGLYKVEYDPDPHNSDNDKLDESHVPTRRIRPLRN